MRKPNEILNLTCVLCGESVYRKHVLCSNCFKDYKQYIREPWFIELINMQRFQDYVDTMERYSLSVLSIPNFIPVEMREPRRKIGAPKKTSDTMKQRATDLRRCGLSYRKIGKILGVSYQTIRRLLLQ